MAYGRHTSYMNIPGQDRLNEEIFRIASGSQPLLTVLGPTASGKTTYSLDLAEKILRRTGKKCEVINADSRQLYRHMNIGTAKISAKEMRGISHVLLDVLNPDEEITAAAFQSMAFTEIDRIHSVGGVPLLVGGSMLYLAAVTDELSFVGAADMALRKELEDAYDRDEGAALYAALQELDPDTAAAFHPRNKPYLLRAMEIYTATGKKPSDLKQRATSRFDLLIIGISRVREELVARINERTKAMFAEGWADEVRELQEKGYGANDPGMKSHGYREIMRYLSEGIPDSEKQLQELIAAKTRLYAKRQMTWWKRDERIRWICI